MRAEVLLLALAAAQAADVTPTLTADRTDLRLSESLRLTLAVEAPGPMRVEFPQELLDDASAANWRLRPAGPAIVTDLPGGRQRWSQTYRADPYLAGEAVPLGLAPVNVFAAGNTHPSQVELKPLTIRVTTAVKGDLAEIRPPTGIEELPAPPSTTGSWERAVAIALGLVTALAIGIVAWRVARRRRPSPLTPEQWAVRELDALEQTPPEGAVFAERLSHVVRMFLERRSGVPATRLTTPELLTAIKSNDAAGVLPADPTRSVLEWCDRVKFAGYLATHEERTHRLVEVLSLVTPEPANGTAPGKTIPSEPAG
jgi:hypothetical protein